MTERNESRDPLASDDDSPEQSLQAAPVDMDLERKGDEAFFARWHHLAARDMLDRGDHAGHRFVFGSPTSANPQKPFDPKKALDDVRYFLADDGVPARGYDRVYLQRLERSLVREYGLDDSPAPTKRPAELWQHQSTLSERARDLGHDFARLIGHPRPDIVGANTETILNLTPFGLAYSGGRNVGEGYADSDPKKAIIGALELAFANLGVAGAGRMSSRLGPRGAPLVRPEPPPIPIGPWNPNWDHGAWRDMHPLPYVAQQLRAVERNQPKALADMSAADAKTIQDEFLRRLAGLSEEQADALMLRHAQQKFWTHAAGAALASAYPVAKVYGLLGDAMDLIGKVDSEVLKLANEGASDQEIAERVKQAHGVVPSVRWISDVRKKQTDLTR